MGAAYASRAARAVAPAIPPPDRRRHCEDPDNPWRDHRVAWAVLLRRSWGIDALACPKCGTYMELVAAIEDGFIAACIPDHLGLPSRAPPRGQPWQPQPELALDPTAAAFEHADPPSQFP